MSDFSESELLLLSNYEYFSCSTYKGTIAENISRLKNEDGSFNMEKVIMQGATGDIISDEAAVDILKRLESNEKLANLHMARKLNDSGVRATLFANEDESETALVFRGTGGTYKAWKDNVLGEYQADTRFQKIAADFVKYECEGFNDITVTGHSKGGNLSQYVTIVCGTQVARCISFDGQGFGSNFFYEYEEEIKNSKDKITSINGYNDFVNILLTPVAGTILYVKNEDSISVNMHSCYTMLSNSIFDKDGNFDRELSVISQMPAMKLLELCGDGIVALIDSLPDGGNEICSELLSAYVASVFSNDKGEKYEEDRINATIGEFKQYMAKMLSLASEDDIGKIFHQTYLYLYKDNALAAYEEFDYVYTKVLVFPEIVEDILVRLDYSILGRSFTENALKKIVTKLDKNIRMINKIRETFSDIIRLYDEADALT